MTDLTVAPQSDPTDIYRHRDALYGTDMLIAALKGLNFFTWLSEKPQTVESICEYFGFKYRPVDVMTTYFVASGWVQREGGLLSVTEQGKEHLVEGSPWFIGPYFPPVEDRPIAKDLLELLKTGEPASFASRDDEEDWHKAMETETFAKEFTAMNVSLRSKHQAPKRLVAVMPRRGISAGDGVEGLPRGGANKGRRYSLVAAGLPRDCSYLNKESRGKPTPTENCRMAF